MITIKELKKYFRLHPHYIKRTTQTVLKSIYWNITRQKVAAINATFGLGGLTLDMDNPIQKHLLDPKLKEAYTTKGIDNLWPYEYYEWSQEQFPIKDILSVINSLEQEIGHSK